MNYSNYVELSQNDDLQTIIQKVNLNFKQLVFSLTQEMNRRSNKTEEDIADMGGSTTPVVNSYIMAKTNYDIRPFYPGMSFAKVGTVEYTDTLSQPSTADLWRRIS